MKPLHILGNPKVLLKDSDIELAYTDINTSVENIKLTANIFPIKGYFNPNFI